MTVSNAKIRQLESSLVHECWLDPQDISLSDRNVVGFDDGVEVGRALGDADGTGVGAGLGEGVGEAVG